ncbi:MAG: GrxA family glutaredoxin [bacterium]
MSRYTIFGHEQCPYCHRARQVLDQKNLAYRYVDIHKENVSPADLEKTIGKPVRTVPQIFHGEQYVGGYTELMGYLSANAAA